MKIRSLALIFLATFCLHASISVRTAELSVNGKNLILKNKISGDWKSAPLSIALFDGKAKKCYNKRKNEGKDQNERYSPLADGLARALGAEYLHSARQADGAPRAPLLGDHL